MEGINIQIIFMGFGVGRLLKLATTSPQRNRAMSRDFAMSTIFVSKFRF